ncbi:hypothetical protein D3C79_1029620 [compost metagenome]
MTIDKYRYALIDCTWAIIVSGDQSVAGRQQKTPFICVEIDRNIVLRYAGSGGSLGIQCQNAAASGGQRDQRQGLFEKVTPGRRRVVLL